MQSQFGKKFSVEVYIEPDESWVSLNWQEYGVLYDAVFDPDKAIELGKELIAAGQRVIDSLDHCACCRLSVD